MPSREFAFFVFCFSFHNSRSKKRSKSILLFFLLHLLCFMSVVFENFRLMKHGVLLNSTRLYCRVFTRVSVNTLFFSSWELFFFFFHGNFRGCCTTTHCDRKRFTYRGEKPVSWHFSAAFFFRWSWKLSISKPKSKLNDRRTQNNLHFLSHVNPHLT